jgi:hypothetical protein
MVIGQRDFPAPMTFSPIASLTKASRAGIYASRPQGEMAPIWQQTPVSFSFLKPVLWSKIEVHSGLSGASATWRRDHFETAEHRFRSTADLVRAAGINLPADVK